MKKDPHYRQLNQLPIRYLPLMVLAALAINILSLALPLTMKQIYGKVVLSKSVETLTVLLVGCVVALILEALLRRTKESTSKWIASKHEHLLTNYLIKKYLNQYEPERGGRYNANLDNFNAISKVTDYYSTNYYQLFVDLPFCLLFLYLIYMLGGVLVWVPIVLSVIYMLIMMVNAKWYHQHRLELLNSNDEVMNQLTETLEKIHLIKAAGLEAFQIERYKKHLDQSVAANYKTNQLLMLPELVYPYFTQTTLFVLLLSGGYLMIQGQVSFGDITACALLGGRAVAPVHSLMNHYLKRRDIRLMKDRIEAILGVEAGVQAEKPLFPEEIEGTIELLGVTYSNIQTHKNEHLSFTIPSGSFIQVSPSEFLSYSQVLRKMAGYEPVSKGEILIDNLDISEWDMSGLNGRVAYLTDQVNLFKGTLLENITYFNNHMNIDALDAAALTGLDVLAATLPDGFETQLDSQSNNYLSSAFLQRLNLTRALIVRPRVLIIDRIDEGMDQQTKEIFLWLLGKVKQKMTLIIASERSEIKALATGYLSNH